MGDECRLYLCTAPYQLYIIIYIYWPNEVIVQTCTARDGRVVEFHEIDILKSTVGYTVMAVGKTCLCDCAGCALHALPRSPVDNITSSKFYWCIYYGIIIS